MLYRDGSSPGWILLEHGEVKRQEVRGGPVFLDTNLWKISGSLLSV